MGNYFTEKYKSYKKSKAVDKAFEKGAETSSRGNVAIPTTTGFIEVSKNSPLAKNYASRIGGGGSGGGSSSNNQAQASLEQARIQAEAKRVAEAQAKQIAKDQQARQDKIQAGTIGGQLDMNKTSSPQPLMISRATNGGIFTGEQMQRPFGSRVKQSISSAKSFARGEGSFGSIFDPLSPVRTRERGVTGGVLFADKPDSRGTIIPGFQGAGFIPSGLTTGEFKLEQQKQRGELPEFAKIKDPIRGTEKEIRLGGSLGVPREAVISGIEEKAFKGLQSDITSGTLVIPGEGEDFQKAAQIELQKRTDKGVGDFKRKRGSTDFTGGKQLVPLGAIAEVGAITALSFTPTGSAIAGGLLTGRGTKNILQSAQAPGLTKKERAVGITTGALDIGFGLGISGRGVSQVSSGLLSKQAIKESQKELSSKLFVPSKQAKVIGRGKGTALIETSQIRTLKGGLTKQEVKTLSLVTEASGGRVASPGGKLISKTQIFDPITGKIIKGSKETFNIGTKFPLDVSRGGRAGGVEIPDLITARGKSFIKKKGASSFTEFDTLSVGIKSKKGTGILGFQKGETLLSTEEALFKETGRKSFLRSGKQVTRFSRAGTRISPTERIFKETGDDLFGKVGRPVTTREGLPIVKIKETGVRVRDAASFDFIVEPKNVPKLGDLFSVSPQPFKPTRVPRVRTTKTDFPKSTQEGVINLVTETKTTKIPPIIQPSKSGQVLIQVPKNELISFKESSKVAASAVSKGASLIPPSQVSKTSSLPLIAIPKMVGGNGLQTVKISRPKLEEKFKQKFDLGIGTKFKGAFDTKTKTDSGFKTGSLIDTASATKTAQASAQAFQFKQATKKDFLYNKDTVNIFTTIDTPFKTPSYTGKFRIGGFGFGLPKLPVFKKPKSKAQKGKQRTQYQPSFTASALNIRAVKVPSIAGLSIRPIISSKVIKKRKKSKRKK